MARFVAACLTVAVLAHPVSAQERDDKLDVARQVIEKVRYGALVTVDADGQPRARTVDPFPPTDDMHVWIATLPTTRKLQQIKRSPQVTLYYADPEGGSYVTIMGTAVVHEDLETKKRWKHPDVDAFWPDYPDGYALIEVRPSWLELVAPDVAPDGVTWRPQAVQFEPESGAANPPSEKAFEALERGDYEAALRGFARVIETAPGTADTYFGMGRAQEGLGDDDAAMASYRQTLQLSPYHRSARFRLGKLLLRGGAQAEARQLLKGYEPFRLWNHQVELLRAMVDGGMLDEADHRQKTLALVNLLLDGNALDEAERALDGAGARYAHEAPFSVARARWLMGVGDSERARTFLAEALAQNPDDVDAVWLHAKLDLQSGSTSAALRGYERLLTLWADPPARVHHEIGTAYAMHGRMEDAIVHLEEAVALAPGLARAHADLALAHAQSGNAARAETEYRRALELHPGLVAAQQGLASLLLERGEAASAIELFRASVATRPRDPIARKNLAFALQRAGMVEEAAIELEAARALEMEPR